MTAKIKAAENGPFLVSDPPRLTDHTGAAIDTGGENIALCRCGHSSSKPFCDGTHKEVGFTSANDGEKARNHPIGYEGEVEGVAVTVSYTPAICSHAAHCVSKEPRSFDPDRDPWIQPQHSTLAGLRAAVTACPSGALRLAVGQGPASHENPPHDRVQITVAENGPYYVENVPLLAAFTGAEASTQKYALCRCGLSGLKPFCDGSHQDQGWVAE